MSGGGPTSGGRMLLAILADDDATVGALRDLLSGKYGLDSYQTHRCRGSFPGCPLDRHGVPLWRELVILEAAVPDARADAVFRELHDTCIAGRNDGSMLLMARTRRLGLSAVSE